MSIEGATHDVLIPGAIPETEERLELIECQIQSIILNQSILNAMLVLLKDKIEPVNQ